MDHVARYCNDFEIRAAAPWVETHYGVIYMPINDAIAWEYDPLWGLYDVDGSLIDAAAYYRGPGKNLVGQSEKLDLSDLTFERAPPGKYLYGGNMIGHYGHFLLSTLSRYWIGLRTDLSGYKIVCHGAGTPDGWWSHRFVQEIFSALGLTVQNFVVFKRPTLLPVIRVPRSACEEGNFTHMVYAEWGHAVGRALLRETNLEESTVPIWLSKSGLAQGVQGLVNEDELCLRLSAGGIEIAHLQDLSMADQAALYATRPIIMGALGSAFHTSIFWPPKAQLICLSAYDTITANYGLVDKSNRNNVMYLRAPVEHVEAHELGADMFLDPYRLVKVDEVAGEILAICKSWPGRS